MANSPPLVSQSSLFCHVKFPLEAAAAAQAALEASLARKEAVIQVDLRAVADASAAKKAWEAAGYEKLPVEDESVAYLSKTF